MATGNIQLMPGAAVLPDGSTNNVAPGMSRRQGSEATRKVHVLTLDFDGAGSTVESAWWTFRMPDNYASGGTLIIQWMGNSTTGTVIWQAQVGAVTAADADTPLEHALAAAATGTGALNVTEARRLLSTSITLTMDSAAAGDWVKIVIYRDPAEVLDTASVDAEFLSATFSYTTT